MREGNFHRVLGGFEEKILQDVCLKKENKTKQKKMKGCNHVKSRIYSSYLRKQIFNEIWLNSRFLSDWLI